MSDVVEEVMKGEQSLRKMLTDVWETRMTINGYKITNLCSAVLRMVKNGCSKTVIHKYKWVSKVNT